MTSRDPRAEEKHLLVADQGAVRVLTLNRPHLRNALDMPLRVALAEALESAMAETSVRAVVLAGAGGTFCSGGDVSAMRRQPEAESRPRAEAAQRVVRAVWRGPKPVVAAVEGFAYGAGASLALACDRVVASSDAVFNTAFTGVGLAGDLGISWSLPRRVGAARARQMMLMPEPVRGARALELGLADELTEPGGALARAIADAGRLAAGPPLALAAIKRLLLAGPHDPYETLDREIENQVALFDSEDFAEAVAAYGERRKPVFRGR
ncbi:enoyl-CoA hydratase/isomerase family protein [Streptomyces sp. NPDC004609]|uniref:enoyl-CoA hydratase/isomerase family protein n=1 Tax=Streptomyces sp. NPDC004609 TaxID=3364704 RepID=UPI0036CB81EB